MDDLIAQIREQFSQSAIYGDTFTTIELTDNPVDGCYYRASIEGNYMFEKLPLSADNTSLCDRIQMLSNRSCSPYVLCPKLAQFSDGSPVIGYQFDYTFDSYKQFLPMAFATKNDILHPWWMRELRNLLCGIRSMHFRDVFHTCLYSDESYVVRGNSIYFVNPLVDGSTFSTADKTSHREHDMQDFLAFFISYIQGNSIDWNLFQDLVLYNASEDIKIFLNHPVLKSSSKRLKYIRQIHDCIAHHMNPAVSLEICSFWNDLETITSQSYINWHKKLTPKTFLESFYRNPPNFVRPYNTQLYTDLFRFIRNALSHAKGGGPQEEEKLEREVNDTFPGFLSWIHNLSANPRWNFLKVAREYVEDSNMKEE